MPMSHLKSVRWSRWPVLMATFGWIFLAAASYLQIPLYRQMWFFSWLVIAFGWVWACLWSFTAVISHLSVQAYARATVALIIAVALGAVIWRVDWRTTFIDSTLRLHQGSFAELAAAYREGRPLDPPWWMKYLSVDGEVQAQNDGLYLPIYVDEWRSEYGAGVAYFPSRPGDDSLIQTADGGVGRATRDLGNGWWWVE
ncbi:hypothetical protein ACOZ38_45210 [Sphaerisporangium viridialbum]|uniref:hypothetical protein n=1 Tax=Sphaerisporangium viridialbum TaxID=46189 RepID=UPI003C7864F6